MKLDLAPDLTLPIEAATQTFLIVGKRGSGKSNTAVRMAEQLYHAGVPWVAIDPVDNWKGVKSSRDGKSPGLNVYVFGGPHGDLPLEASAGALVADTIVDHRITAVLSVKHFSGRERGRFVGDFAQRLFQRNKEPLHVFLEEAHEVAPQNPYKGEEEMLGHVARIWKLGRSSGLGGSAVTQRPASLSKNITTQAEILIVHRTLGPQDVAAIREWIKYHGEREEILGQLATLKTGEAFVWAPDFPEGRPIGLKRVLLYQRETFDSAATPKAGQKRVEPKALAAVDLNALSAKMAATIEKAKAFDPKTLRAEIQRLTTELNKKQSAVSKSPAPKTVEKRVLKDQDHRRLENVIKEARRLHERTEAAVIATFKALDGTSQRLVGQLATISVTFNDRADALEKMVRDASAPPAPTVTHPVTPRPQAHAITRDRTRSHVAAGDLKLGAGEVAVLTAIAQHGEHGVTREQLTVLTGYKRSSRDTYLQRLRAAELVTPGGAELVATDAGQRVLGPDFEPLPTGPALVQYWLSRLPEGERRCFEIVLQGGGQVVDREAISEATGYKRSSRDTYLQRLGARRLIVVDRAGVRASATLFEGGRS